MRRIFVEAQSLPSGSMQAGAEFELGGDAFHHAVGVLRMKKGEQFDALVGDGKIYSCEIVTIKKKSVDVRVRSVSDLPAAPLPEVHLAVSLPRLSTFEWIVEKSVELGVKSIQPLTSEFSFIKKSSELGTSKLERLQKIIRSATEQSRRGDLMALAPVISLEEWAGRGLPSIFAYEAAEGLGPESRSLKQALRDKVSKPPPPAIWGLCGSEGGFSPKEVQLLQSFNHFPVSMGHQILRAETACLALVSVIKYEFDHLGDGNGRTR